MPEADRDLKKQVAPSPAAPEPERNSGNVAAPLPATVDWSVNYNEIAGESTHILERTGATQMVVNELKVRPDGAASTVLHGGNMARTGSVMLGSTKLPVGKGTVSADVQYALKRSLTVTVKVKPPISKAELSNLQARATTMAREKMVDSGDYGAIANQVAVELRRDIEGHEVAVEINPLGAAHSAAAEYAVEETVYDIIGDTKFEVTIDPSVKMDRAGSHSLSGTDEDYKGNASENGTRTGIGTDTSQKTVDKTTVTSAFKTNLQTTVQDVFDTLTKIAWDVHGTGQHEDHSDATWNLGFGPAKDAKDPTKGADGKPAADAKDDSFTTKVKRFVEDKGKWLLKTGEGLLEKDVPIVVAAAEVAGDLFGALNTRGSITYEHVGGDKDGHSTTGGSSGGTDIKIDNLHSVATQLATELVTATEHDVETIVNTHLQTDLSYLKKDDDHKRHDRSWAVTEQTVLHENGRPRMTLRKM